MGDRQGKKLQAYNTNGGLLFSEKNHVRTEKRRAFVAQTRKEAALNGAASMGCGFGGSLWDGNGKLGAVDRGACDGGDGKGVGAGLGIGLGG